MAEQGVKELVLVAQETTIYGIDLYGKPSLHLLLKELCKIQELYVDPDSVLLSGGHLSGTRSDDEGRAESLSLPGSADSACQR